jgi:hypothetical protein
VSVYGRTLQGPKNGQTIMLFHAFSCFFGPRGSLRSRSGSRSLRPKLARAELATRPPRLFAEPLVAHEAITVEVLRWPTAWRPGPDAASRLTDPSPWACSRPLATSSFAGEYKHGTSLRSAASMCWTSSAAAEGFHALVLDGRPARGCHPVRTRSALFVTAGAICLSAYTADSLI